MKKLLILLMMLLMATSVMGFTDILSVTNITAGYHPTVTLSGIALCYEAGDLIYCGYNGDDPNNLYIFNPATEVWSNTSSSFASKIYYEEHSCQEYDGDSYVYCASKDWGGDTTFTMLKMDDDGNNVLNLNVTNEPETFVLAAQSCKIRPGTDEFWCVLRGQSSNQLYLGYYDISDDTYTYVVSDIRPQYKIDGAWNDYGQGCAWDATGENYFCSGGQNQDSVFEANRTQALTVYNVATNTTTYEDMPVIASDGEFGALHHSRVVGDTLYMYGFETSQWLELVDTIVYYDINADTSAVSGTSLLREYAADLGGCVQYNASTDYCLFGYADDPDWNEFTSVWRLDFNYTLPVEEPEDGGEATENTTYDEGNYSVPNNFTVSGDDIVVNFSGSVLSDGNVVISGNNVVVTGLVVEEALVVTGSNVDYTDVERAGVSFSEFRDVGDSTDLIIEVDLTDVDLVLDDVDGKVDFDTNVDLSAYSDLDAVVDIGVNSITIDSVSAPNLDVSARITFYDTGYQTEEEVLIYRNGELCTVECTLVSVNNGVVVADVTGFSTYLLVGVGLDISQENFLSLRTNMIYILSAFALVVVLIAAMIILTFIFSGAQVDMTQIIVVVLLLAVGFAALLAVFVTIMNNFVVV